MTVVEVFEKYKHLDAALSDPAWIEGEDRFPSQIARELWQAIKDGIGLDMALSPSSPAGRDSASTTAV